MKSFVHYKHLCLIKTQIHKKWIHVQKLGVLISVFICFAQNSTKAFAVGWQEPQQGSAWKGIWGKPDDDAIYTGMWSYHINSNNKNKNNTNRAIGINFKGFFFSELLNSYYKRGYTVGVQRIMYSQKFGYNMQFDIGYRLGVIWGYKNTQLIGNRPISYPLPFPQLIVNLSWELLGVQFGYCGVVLSAVFFVKF